MTNECTATQYRAEHTQRYHRMLLSWTDYSTNPTQGNRDKFLGMFGKLVRVDRLEFFEEEMRKHDDSPYFRLDPVGRLRMEELRCSINGQCNFDRIMSEAWESHKNKCRAEQQPYDNTGYCRIEIYLVTADLGHFIDDDSLSRERVSFETAMNMGNGDL